MVTVVSIISNNVNKHGLSGTSLSPSYGASSLPNVKSYVNKNFQAKNKSDDKDNKKPKEDRIIENTWKNRMQINWVKTTDIPLVHFPRGLGGAPDYTFFEFLQTAKFPFYVGGPVLAALFYAGVKKDNMMAGNAAKNVAKHMALGVGLYYLGAATAKFIINSTVKAARGVDLNHPYEKAVSTETNKTGFFKKDVEYHKVYESADFTRWDLLYDKKGKNPKEINKNYSKIAKKYGIKEDKANDIDSTVQPLIKKTVIMARAWQYALTAFFVTLGIGMANQPAWTQESFEGFKKTIRYGIFGKGQNLKNRLDSAKIAVYDYMLKPFGKSFKQFWQGHSKGTSIAGKTVITASALATLTAVSLLLKKTTGRHHKLENSGNNKHDEVKQ